MMRTYRTSTHYYGFCVFLLSVCFCLPFLLTAFANETEESPQSPSLQTIAWGLESSYPCRIPTLLVIRDQEDWRRIWNLHLGSNASKARLPEIDFKLFSVLSLFAGQRPGVEGLEIQRVERPGDSVTVYVLEVEPGLNCPPPGGFKNPFHMVKVKALKKGIIPLLEIEVLSRQCGW